MLYLESFHGGRHDSKPTRDVGFQRAEQYSYLIVWHSSLDSPVHRQWKEVNPTNYLDYQSATAPSFQAPDLGTKLHHLDLEKRHGFTGYSSGGDGWSCASTLCRDDLGW